MTTGPHLGSILSEGRVTVGTVVAYGVIDPAVEAYANDYGMDY